MHNNGYREPPLNTLPRPRASIANQGHLVQNLVVFRSLVGSNRLPVIRDVKNPEPTIEADFSIARIRSKKTNPLRPQTRNRETSYVPSATETHPNALHSSTVLSHCDANVVE